MSQKINRQETLSAGRRKVSGDEFANDEILEINVSKILEYIK